MLKIYQGDYQSEQELTAVIEKTKADIEQWKTNEGVPAPLISEEVQQILDGIEYQFIPMTEEEAQAEEAEKAAKATQEKYEAKKQKAQTEPSAKYAEYRASEFPNVVEQLDYIYHHGVESWKKDMIDPIKAKYPKP